MQPLPKSINSDTSELLKPLLQIKQKIVNVRTAESLRKTRLLRFKNENQLTVLLTFVI